MTEWKPCTLIGSDKGGVGKSLLAQLMITAYDTAHEDAIRTGVVDGRTRTPLTVIEIDNQRRLSSLMPGRVGLAIDPAPPIGEVAKDRTIGETFLNQVYEEWTKGPSLTDLGANVTSSLCAWAKHYDIESFANQDGIRFRFVAVMSADDQALKSAATALHNARVSLGANTDLFLVMNDTMGTTGYRFFENGESMKRLSAFVENTGINIVTLPFCDSMLMEWGRANGLTIKEMITRDTELASVIADAAGLDRLSARKHVKRFLEWIDEVQKELHPLFAKPLSQQFAA